LDILKLCWIKDKFFNKIPPLEAEIQPDDTLLCEWSVLNYFANVTQCIRHVINVCGERGMFFRKIHFLETVNWARRCIALQLKCW